MGKTETVERYISAYLENKPASVAEKFREKSVDRQYAAIMAWRRKQRQAEETPDTAEEIIAHVRKSKVMIENLGSLTPEEISAINRETEELKLFLQEFSERMRRREIEELEAQRAEIEARLNSLRNV